MRFAKISKSGLVSAAIGAVALFFLTVAMNSLAVSSAQATPAIAKGKPCGTCHAGSPPSKSNLPSAREQHRGITASTRATF